nr:MAG TPA: hypothetical protein [Caudoviricetes sp.]
MRFFTQFWKLSPYRSYNEIIWCSIRLINSSNI